MTTIVEFLLARYDEIEATARAATKGPWHVNSETYPEAIYSAEGYDVVAGGKWGGEAAVFDAEDAHHIALHDPAFVLRKIEADRAILGEYQRLEQLPDILTNAVHYSWVNVVRQVVILPLAEAFDQHPDYDEAWRP